MTQVKVCMRGAKWGKVCVGGVRSMRSCEMLGAECDVSRMARSVFLCKGWSVCVCAHVLGKGGAVLFVFIKGGGHEMQAAWLTDRGLLPLHTASRSPCCR